MHGAHKNVKPFACEKCTALFNNLQALSNHISVVHCLRLVKCTECPYAMMTKACMRQHVRKHAKGFCCMHCQKYFATKKQLQLHTSVHQARERFDCDDPDAFFFSQPSMKLHYRGKHGPGYVCPQCGLIFDSPSQRQHHMKNC